MRNAVITIEGRVFKDATTVGQKNSVKFTVGVYNGKNKNTGKGQSEFFDVVDWNNVHTFVPKDAEYVKVTGELVVDEYQAKDGTMRKRYGVTPTKIDRAANPFDNAPVVNADNDKVDF